MNQSENKTALKIKYPDFSIDSEIDENLAKELQTITYDKLTTSSTTRTIKNIKKNIIATLRSNYPFVNGRVKEVADIILKKHGLHEDSFDFVNLFESGLHENINDISIDDNANKNEKVFRGYLNELEKSVDKLIGYDVLYRTMKDLYGEKEAKKLTGEMYTYALGLSDSSNIILPYCWSLDASKLVTTGREFGVLKSKPAKRVSSYISMLCETIHQMSNHLAGAIAIGSFFLDLAHLMIYKERRTLNELRTDKRIRKMIENEVQQFIHSINHLSRNGAESPFTNVSIFDRPKLEGLISDDNYGWYFPNHKAISTDNDLQDKMSNEDFKKYVIDYITEIQNLFMDFFEKGDPLQNGMPYRFPVCFPGEEIFTLNNKISTWEQAFKAYNMGWTDVSDQNLTTLYNGKPVKIKRVYKGLSTSFIKLDGTNGRPLIVTPDHKLKLFSGELVKAKDIKLKDKIALDQSIIDEKQLLQEIDVSQFVENTALIGYKIKTTDHVKSIFQKDGEYNEPYVGACNHKSILLKSIRDTLNDDDFYIIPSHDEERIKTHLSSRKQSIPRYIKLDYNFGRFLGLFYAEGHNSRCGELGISLNANELETISYVQHYLQDILGIRVVARTFNNNNGIQLCFNSKILGELLFALVKKHAGNKCFTDLPLNANKNFRLGILHGLIEGDGSCNSYSATLATISKLGAHSIMLIANSLGIKTTLKIDYATNRGFGKESSKPCYIIHFSKKDLIDLGYNTSQKLQKLVKTSRPTYHKRGFIVNSIKSIEYNEPKVVYNIEVDNEEHLFTLPGGIITSNCTVNFSKVKNESTSKFEIQDKEFLKAVCKRDISRFNIFSSAGTKICSCCRLINDIEMLDFASQSNSLGGGGSISLGSHRVITINFQRIALECQSFEDYLNILSFRVEEAAKILKAHKLMLLKFTKEGYEPFIANGFINPKRLFSTFGLLGIYEANKTLRQKFDIPEDRDITGEILDYFNTRVNEVSKQYGIIGNIEQIPGESFAVRLAEADKAIYGFGDDYYKLYANQFCPLYEDFTLAEKIKTDGKYNMKLTGGGIVHIQIATQTTPQQNEQLIKFACAEGCEHFALNRVYSRCKKCGKVYNTKVDKCDCGAEGEDLERLTRVIGFFTPVSSWGKVRREWEFPRRRFTDVSESQMK